MNLLLDTHIFLWFISADARLPDQFRDAIVSPSNTAFLSVVSIWECIIKYELGKLPLPQPAAIYLPEQRVAHRIESLPVTEDVLLHLASLPPLHRDPFDRLLIAQSQQYEF